MTDGRPTDGRPAVGRPAESATLFRPTAILAIAKKMGSDRQLESAAG
jgi:hypothetical protein